MLHVYGSVTTCFNFVGVNCLKIVVLNDIMNPW